MGMSASARAFNLAQVNVALPREPLGSALLADFVAALGPINALADSSPGFVWRLQGDGGDSTSIKVFGDDRILVNMSTWESLDKLADFVYKSAHSEVMRARRKWFEPMAEVYVALWWVPVGHRPSVAEAEERVAHLRQHGPTPFAFSFKRPFPPPGSAVQMASRDEVCA
jgi:hypothetical protein